jgi:hypothetical protein
LDVDGFATCPDCGERVNCGTVGISIITKRHRGTKKCLKTRDKRDKKEKGKVQKSLLAFMRPKPTLVPSTVASTDSQVHGIGNPPIYHALMCRDVVHCVRGPVWPFGGIPSSLISRIPIDKRTSANMHICGSCRTSRSQK